MNSTHRHRSYMSEGRSTSLSLFEAMVITAILQGFYIPTRIPLNKEDAQKPPF